MTSQRESWKGIQSGISENRYFCIRQRDKVGGQGDEHRLSFSQKRSGQVPRFLDQPATRDPLVEEDVHRVRVEG